MSRIDRERLRLRADSISGPSWVKKGAQALVASAIYILDIRVRIINALVVRGLIKRPDTTLNLVPQYELKRPIIGKPSVVIIAEVSISQCYFYRVQQRAEQFQKLGYKVHIVRWNDYMEAMRLLYIANLIFFYRVPYFAGVAALYERARLLKKPTFFDVDDLIFDRDLMEARFKNEQRELGKTVYQGLLDGAELYTQSMLAADIVTASTHSLAKAMQAVTNERVSVIANGLSREDFLEPQKSTEHVDIIYGSGTKTHDRDFAQIVPALIATLEKYKHARLHLAGQLTIDERLKKLDEQIIIYPMLEFGEYQQLLARCHIALAPLEEGVFADAKSEIKWLEASVHGLASIVSRTKTYEECIVEGENGFICSSFKEWGQALEKLISDEDVRIAMAESAQSTLMARYSLGALSNVLADIIKPVEFEKPDYASLNILAIEDTSTVGLGLYQNDAFAGETQWNVFQENDVIRYNLYASNAQSSQWIAQLADYLGVNVTDDGSS